MSLVNQFGNFKYKCARILEGNPLFSTFIYNNISHFKFLFPHEKDYHGIKAFCKDQKNGDFVDIGANIGLSTIGFRKLGYENRIVLFEANPALMSYLQKLKDNVSNIEIQQLALGAENTQEEIHVAYYKGTCLHTFSSFNKNFIQNSLRKSFPEKYRDIEVRSTPVTVRRFDDLEIKIRPQFIKIDVEGVEHEILKGMMNTIRTYKPVILIEYNVANFSQVFELMKPTHTPFSYQYHDGQIAKVQEQDLPRLTDPNDPYRLRNLFFVPS